MRSDQKAKADVLEALEGSGWGRFKDTQAAAPPEVIPPVFPVINIRDVIPLETNVEDVNTVQDIKDDGAHARAVSHNILAQQQELIKSMAEFLNVVPSAQGYKVINEMMKSAQDMCKDMLVIQKTLKELQTDYWQERALKAEAGESGISNGELPEEKWIFNSPAEALEAMESRIIDMEPEHTDNDAEAEV